MRSVGEDLELLDIARRGALARGYRMVRWGFTVRTDRVTGRDMGGPDDQLLGEVALKATTLGGERLWLTPRLVDSLGLLVLQGEVRGYLWHTDAGVGCDEPLADVRVVLCPSPTRDDFEEMIRFEDVLEAGTTRTLICLCEDRPPGWPP
jgi:hypothetical protein